MVANWVARWFGDGLRFAEVEDTPRWFTGTHWADDAARGRFGQCVRLTTRFLSARAATIPIPDDILTATTEALLAQAATRRSPLSRVAATARAEATLRQGLTKAALAYRNRPKLIALERLVQSHPPIRVSVADFDADPWLLNVQNGTIDVTTGSLRPHDPGDLITKYIDIPSDPAAECPRFRQFLTELFPVPASQPESPLPAFLQTFVGACLTGDVAGVQALVIFTGGGSNGKSTLVKILQHLLGPYCVELQPAVLLDDSRGRSAQNERKHEYARLKGVRLAFVLEPPDEGRLSIEAMKKLTGGDTMTGRPMYESALTFAPTHKLVLMCNEAPEIRSQGTGVWRRPLVVPFTQRFWKPTDHDFKDKPADAPLADLGLADTLGAELPGILAWAVAGARTYHAEGLPAPEAVRTATQAYRDDQDLLGPFLAECTTRQAGAWSAFADLYAGYIRWRKAALQMNPDATWTPDLSETMFGRLLTQHGYAITPGTVDGRKARGRQDLVLRQDPEPF